MRSWKILPNRLERGQGTYTVSQDLGKISDRTVLHQLEKKNRDTEHLCLSLGLWQKVQTADQRQLHASVHHFQELRRNFLFTATSTQFLTWPLIVSHPKRLTTATAKNSGKIKQPRSTRKNFTSEHLLAVALMFRAKSTIRFNIKEDGDFLQAEAAGTSSTQGFHLSSTHLLVFTLVVAIVGN